MSESILACAVACAAAVPLGAQTTPIAAPTMVSTVSADGGFLRAGTPVPLKMQEELTTKGKKLKVG